MKEEGMTQKAIRLQGMYANGDKAPVIKELRKMPNYELTNCFYQWIRLFSDINDYSEALRSIRFALRGF